jgi:hypothetical protein
MTYRRLRKKVKVVEAVQWIGDNLNEVMEFGGKYVHVHGHKELAVTTPSGPVDVPLGHWIVKGAPEDFYPVPHENIVELFEPADIGGSEGLDFGGALAALKEGRRVARSGWNGKGMWIALSPGSTDLPAEKFWAGPNREYAKSQGGCATVLPCITMKTVNGPILMGWLASQTDMLAEDWEVVD